MACAGWDGLRPNTCAPGGAPKLSSRSTKPVTTASPTLGKSSAAEKLYTRIARPGLGAEQSYNPRTYAHIPLLPSDVCSVCLHAGDRHRLDNARGPGRREGDTGRAGNRAPDADQPRVRVADRWRCQSKRER